MNTLNSIVDGRIEIYKSNLKLMAGCDESITKSELELIMLDIAYLESTECFRAADELRGLLSDVKVRASVYSEVLYD